MNWLLLFIIFDGIALLAAYLFATSSRIYNNLYPRFYSEKCYQHYSSNVTVSIFVPCKGVDDHFEENIHRFLARRYLGANLYFIVEDESDPAYLKIKNLTKSFPHAHLVVAGIATSCGQKNYNLLQGIKASGQNDDVYVFLDSYSTISDQQLRDLISPLSDSTVAASVGFKWNILRKNKTLGERYYAFLIGLQWSLLTSPFIPAVWGGATAIKRETFEKLPVREYWKKTVVDDMSLVQILQNQGKTSVFVPSCIIEETQNVYMTVKQAIVWFKRQVLYIKFYLRSYWIATLVILLCASSNIVCFPPALAYALVHPGQEIALFTATTGIFTLFSMIYGLLLKRSGDDNHSKLSWFLLSPLYILFTFWSYLIGTFTKVLHWRGISYHLDYHGHVKKIVRN